MRGDCWGRMEGDGHLFWTVLLVGVGLNSSGDPHRGSSCWELVLWKVVRLLVGLSWGGGGWSWDQLGVGHGLGLGWVWLNSGGGLRL